MQPSRASRLTVDQQAQRLLHGQPLCRDGALLRLPALLGCAVIIVGNWLATMRHEGLVNGAYQMAPVGELRSAARVLPPPVQLVVGQGVAMQWQASAPSAWDRTACSYLACTPGPCRQLHRCGDGPTARPRVL